MTAWGTTNDLAVDVVFPLDGKVLPRDHASAIRRALCARVPWLETDPGAGIHPVKLVPGGAVPPLLSGRARLTLRVGSGRFAELRELAGLGLAIDGHSLRLGLPHLHELLPHGTLYAYRVAADSADEGEFMAMVHAGLANLSIAGETVCGKHQRHMIDGQFLDAFSLMLHALPPEQSIRLQMGGLGAHRLTGCGIFVPHRSAAAVGA